MTILEEMALLADYGVMPMVNMAPWTAVKVNEWMKTNMKAKNDGLKMGNNTYGLRKWNGKMNK